MTLGTPPRTFQDLIFALQKYWADQGCVILQPYDMEMGAGTFHTATFLRAIGPEPWSAAYVQPSRRPTDGRYGDNPFRLQHYYQFQVVIKPSPLAILDLYLGIAARARLRHAGARRALRRRQLGVADAGRLGAGLGGVAQRHGGHAVHLLPAGRRARLQAGDRRDHLWARAPRHVPAGRREHFRHRVGRWTAGQASPTATCTTRTKSSSRPTTSKHADTAVLLRRFDDHEAEPARGSSRRSSRCPPTSR